MMPVSWGNSAHTHTHATTGSVQHSGHGHRVELLGRLQGCTKHLEQLREAQHSVWLFVLATAWITLADCNRSCRDRHPRLFRYQTLSIFSPRELLSSILDSISRKGRPSGRRRSFRQPSAEAPALTVPWSQHPARQWGWAMRRLTW